MAWDSTPPAAHEIPSTSWDSAPPSADDLKDEKTLGGFAENVGENALRLINPVEIVKGLGSAAKQGLYELPKAAAESSVDFVKGAAKAATGGGLPSMEDVEASPLIAKTKEMTEPIAKDPVGFAYKNPLDTAMLAATGAGIVSPFLGGETAAAAPKELPVMEPGAKTGDPHALFSYNDEFGPGGTPRSQYTVFGDPEHPVFQGKAPSGAGGHGSTMSKADVDALGIPITGREPRSVGKWDPLEETAAPKPNTIGQRLAARTTAQALDVNPLAIRKLAAKAGTSPEEAILDLGNKANELIPNLIEPLDSANSKFNKILDAHDGAGEGIGRFVRMSSKATGGTFPEAQDTINALKAAAKDYDQVDGGDITLQKTAERLESLEKEGKLDFDRLNKVKTAIGKGFNKTEPPPATEEIYGIINDKLQGVVDRLSIQDPKIAPELSRLKQIYTVTSRLLPAMSRTAAREVAGNSVGGGVFSKMIPSAIGGAVGGVPGALMGGAAKYLQEAIAPDLGKNLAFMAMKAKPELVAAVKRAVPGISAAEAEAIAGRISQGDKKPGMFKGGTVPDDVKRYVSGC